MNPSLRKVKNTGNTYTALSKSQELKVFLKTCHTEFERFSFRGHKYITTSLIRSLDIKIWFKIRTSTGIKFLSKHATIINIVAVSPVASDSNFAAMHM